MWGFVLIVISVVVALIGVIKDNKAKAEERAFAFGLNRLGVVLLTLTFFGFVAGLGKEINDSRVLQPAFLTN